MCLLHLLTTSSQNDYFAAANTAATLNKFADIKVLRFPAKDHKAPIIVPGSLRIAPLFGSNM
jgi:hypothetical protein